MWYIEDDQNARYTYLGTKPVYTRNVLTGEWFQSRCDNLPVDSTAIVPCVVDHDRKGYERRLTTNQETYSLKDFIERNVTSEYSDRKQCNFANYKNSVRTKKPLDAEKYIHNYTSLNHLVYELFPAMAQRNAVVGEEEALKGHHVPPPDLLDSYGNRPKSRRSLPKPFCQKPTVYGRTFKGCSALRK